MKKDEGWGLTSILTLIFVVLKLTKLIKWSWIWVLSPLWINFGLFLILLTITCISISINERKWKK